MIRTIRTIAAAFVFIPAVASAAESTITLTKPELDSLIRAAVAQAQAGQATNDAKSVIDKMNRAFTVPASAPVKKP